MKPIGQYRSLITSKEEREVVSNGIETLVEQGGVYLIKTEAYGVQRYRGIDAQHDYDLFVDCYAHGR